MLLHSKREQLRLPSEVTRGCFGCTDLHPSVSSTSSAHLQVHRTGEGVANQEVGVSLEHISSGFQLRQLLVQKILTNHSSVRRDGFHGNTGVLETTES